MQEWSQIENRGFFTQKRKVYVMRRSWDKNGAFLMPCRTIDLEEPLNILQLTRVRNHSQRTRHSTSWKVTWGAVPTHAGYSPEGDSRKQATWEGTGGHNLRRLTFVGKCFLMVVKNGRSKDIADVKEEIIHFKQQSYDCRTQSLSKILLLF